MCGLIIGYLHFFFFLFVGFPSYILCSFATPLLFMCHEATVDADVRLCVAIFVPSWSHQIDAFL